MYAILSHGGRQFRVSAGDRLLVDRLVAEVGSVIALGPLLLTGGEGEATKHGKDLDGMRVAATVVAHRRGRKLRIFKYRAKKRSRKVAGYRSNLTELRVESILARGAALPGTAPAKVADAPAAKQAQPAKAATRAEATRARRTPTAAAPTATATTEKPAAAAKPATAAKPARASRKQPQTGAEATAAAAAPAPAEPAPAKARAKATPKPRTAKKKEPSDGA